MAKDKKDHPPKSPKKEHNPFDRILKENIGPLFYPLVEKQLGVSIRKSEELKDKLQTTLEREADFLRKIVPEAGGPFILHLEFQTQDEADMVYRMQEYYAILLKKYRLPIRQFVFYLGEQASKMDVQLPQTEVFTGFEMRSLRDLDYGMFLRSQVPEEVMLAILADFGDEGAEEAIGKILHRLLQLKTSPILLQKYLRQMRLLSRLRKGLDDALHKNMEAMALTYDITEDSLYKRGILKGKEEGKKEGKEEGRQEGEYQKAMVVAEKCLQRGLDISLAADISGLSTKEVMAIADRLGLDR